MVWSVVPAFASDVKVPPIVQGPMLAPLQAVTIVSALIALGFVLPAINAMPPSAMEKMDVLSSPRRVIYAMMAFLVRLGIPVTPEYA